MNKMKLAFFLLSPILIAIVAAQKQEQKRLILVPLGSNLSTAAPCDDIAIIGAGIAGSYTAWKLRHKNLSIKVYEYNNRTGGRLQTVHVPGASDINIELGGMRFIPSAHRLINRTAHDLGLSIIDFSGGILFGNHDIAYLRGVHMKPGEFTGLKSPYKLKHNEKNKSTPELGWEIFVNGTNANSTLSAANLRDENIRLHIKTRDNIDLYKQSHAAVYAKTDASAEAVKLLDDVFGFYSYTGEITAAVFVPKPKPVDPAVSTRTITNIKTIDGGMEQIPKLLMEQFLGTSTSHKLAQLHNLKAIQRRRDGAYDLSFVLNSVTDGYVKPSQNQIKTCARKVIITVPRHSLERIDWSGFKTEEIHNLITKSVKDSPASKVFLVYDNPWWRNTPLNFSHAVTDLPNRQTYDFGTSATSSKSVLLASYTDMDDVKLWRELQKEGQLLDTGGVVEKSNEVSTAVVKVIHKYLAELYDIPISSIPAPISGMMALWDDVPYGAAWTVWMPGFIWEDVQHRMIKPSLTDDVYVASGSFFHGEASAWSESALETVEEMLGKLNI